MIRLVQRKLIIPRGDTGTFSVPVISTLNTGDVAVFTIIDMKTKRKVYEKIIDATPDTISIRFEHRDTVNLPVGRYYWDIKFYQNPEWADNELINGTEVDSYYAAYSLPECEIRLTGDNLLTADDSPTTTITPYYLNVLNATVNDVNHAKTEITELANAAEASANDANEAATRAQEQADSIKQLSATVTMLDTNDEPTSVYNSETGVLSLGIPAPNSIFGILKTSEDGLVDTYTISYTNGASTTFTVTNGMIPNLTIGTVQEGATAAASITGTAANPILNLTLPNANVPTKVSELENDAGYLTEHQDLSNYVQKTDYATASDAGVVKIDPSYGIQISSSGYLQTSAPSDSQIKSANKTAGTYRPIVPNVQHISAFYGLAKAAGDTTQSQSSNAVGTYTNEAKAAIQTMLDVPSNADIPTQVSDLTNDAGYLTTETDPTVPAWAKAAQKPTYTAAEVGAPTVQEMNEAIANVNTMKIHICAQGEYNSETGVPTIQNPDTQTFYLVPGGENNNLFIEWAYVNGAWERFGSADVDLSNYVQKTDYASTSEAGVVKIMSNGGGGIDIVNNQYLRIAGATDAHVKSGSSAYKPLSPSVQHLATFYGLAKAAGDSTQSASNNAVGTYTDEAKAAIQQMLDVPSTSDMSAYATKADTVLETSLSRGRKSETTIGLGSLAFGNDVEASSSYTMAFGHKTSATGPNSYSEGNQTLASGNASHAEGFKSIATGAGSHAEGSNTIANAAYSHVEGKYNIEDSIQSWPTWTPNTEYAVGDKVKMLVVNSNNETSFSGYVCKIANNDAEFVTANWTRTTFMNYVYIVGNGTADNARSNAYALDWDGNGYYMGDVYVGANADSTGGTKLVKDVQVAGTSVTSNGVANVPRATNVTPGVACFETNNSANSYGVGFYSNNNNLIVIVGASISNIKTGTNGFKPIVPAHQHESTFYGLSKAAGVDLASDANVSLQTGYPETSKTAIKAMLGVQDGLKVVRLI